MLVPQGWITRTFSIYIHASTLLPFWYSLSFTKRPPTRPRPDLISRHKVKTDPQLSAHGPEDPGRGRLKFGICMRCSSQQTGQTVLPVNGTNRSVTYIEPFMSTEWKLRRLKARVENGDRAHAELSIFELAANLANLARRPRPSIKGETWNNKLKQCPIKRTPPPPPPLHSTIVQIWRTVVYLYRIVWLLKRLFHNIQAFIK